MNKNNNYAFYGSLRKGMYNYEAFKQGMEYKETVVVSGFKLYSLGPYPTIIRTDNEEDKLTVDLFKVSNSEAFRIDRMEKGAGYGYDEITVGDIDYGIYTYDSSAASRLKDRHVPGGDWVKHLRPELEQTEA